MHYIPSLRRFPKFAFETIIGGSCHKYHFCRDKSSVATNTCFVESSSVPLIDDGPLSSFQGRSSNISSFHASLLQAIVGVMSLALCLLVLSQAPQHFRSSEKKPLVRVALPASSLTALSFPFTPACPGYVHPVGFFPILIVTIAWTTRLVTLFLLDLDQFCIPLYTPLPSSSSSSLTGNSANNS